MKATKLTPVIALTALFGCESATLSYDDPRDNPFNKIPVGSVIVLNEPLSFSPNHSRNNIQNGKSLGHGRVNLYEPSCQFYLYDSKESLQTNRTIQPDRFVVTRSGQGIEYVNAKPVEVALVGEIQLTQFRTIDDDTGPLPMKNTMRVHSDQQPQVYEFNCTVLDDPWLRNYVSINQMTQTLGEIASIELAEPTR